jgi:hypothetical protein
MTGHSLSPAFLKLLSEDKSREELFSYFADFGKDGPLTKNDFDTFENRLWLLGDFDPYELLFALKLIAATKARLEERNEGGRFYKILKGNALYLSNVIRSMVDQYSFKETTQLLAAIEGLNIYPAFNLMVDVDEHLTNIMHKTDYESFSSLLPRFARWGIQPSPSLMQVIEDKYAHYALKFEKDGMNSPAYLTSMVYPYQNIGLLPSESQQRLWENGVFKLLKSLHSNWSIFREINNLSKNLHVCAVLNAFSGSKNYLRNTAQNIWDKIKNIPMDEISKTRVSNACLWLDFSCSVQRPAEDQCRSKQEEDLYRTCSTVNPTILYSDPLIPEIGHTVDIPCDPGMYSAEETYLRTLIEVDGPSHLVSRMNRQSRRYDIEYNAPSVLMTGLAEKFTRNAVIFRLPLQALHTIFNANKFIKSEELMHLSVNLEAGAYEIRAEQGKLYTVPFFHPPGAGEERFTHPYRDIAA